MRSKTMRYALLAITTATLMACGGGGGGGTGDATATPPANTGTENQSRSGLMVYSYISKVLGVDMATGQTRTLLFPNYDLSYVGAGVGPSGEVAVAYNSSGIGPTSHLVFLKPDGSQESTVRLNYTIQGVPKYSPDGSKIAFTAGVYSGSEISYFAQVVSRAGENLYFFRGYQRPQWMPDGKLVIHNRTDLNLYLTGLDYRDPLNVIPNSKSINAFSVSPDGTKIAFVRTAAANAPGHVFMMNIDGTGTRQVTDSANSSETNVIFSPDGKELMVTSYGCISVFDNGLGIGNVDDDLIHVIPADSQMLEIRAIRNSGANSRLLDEKGQTRCTGGPISWR
jgi:Tol biopolymer transport system component